MRSIHIIDDIPCARELLHKEIESSLGMPSSERDLQFDSHWEYLWDLLEADVVEKADIVISDLFPASYWKKVPGKPLYKPSTPLPDDPTNIYLGSLDAIQRFMRQVPKLGAHLLVVTFVPNFLETNMGNEVAANSVREVLDGEDLLWFEKPNREIKRENFEGPISKACELVRTNG